MLFLVAAVAIGYPILPPSLPVRSAALSLRPSRSAAAILARASEGEKDDEWRC